MEKVCFIFSDLMFSPLLSYLRNHRSDFLSFHLLIYLLFLGRIVVAVVLV